MSRDEVIKEYKRNLYSFCKQSAYLEEVRDRLGNGEHICEKEIEKNLYLLRMAKDKILSCKAILGYEGELDFTDNCNFYGFRYEEGQLIGDVTKLQDIVLPWIRQFDEQKIYTYEVGTLLMFHYMNQQKRKKKERRQRRFVSIRHKLLSISYTFLAFMYGIKKEDLLDE